MKPPPDSTLARLEAWSHGHKARAVIIHDPNGYGAGCWTVTLEHERGVTVAEEANFWTLSEEEGGEPEYRRRAQAKGVVFAEPQEGQDWAGLDATINAALVAFDAGVWGDAKAPRAFSGATLIRSAEDAAFLAGVTAGLKAAEQACRETAWPTAAGVVQGLDPAIIVEASRE